MKLPISEKLGHKFNFDFCFEPSSYTNFDKIQSFFIPVAELTKKATTMVTQQERAP
jgi:hypothetical protein